MHIDISYICIAQIWHPYRTPTRLMDHKDNARTTNLQSKLSKTNKNYKICFPPQLIIRGEKRAFKKIIPFFFFFLQNWEKKFAVINQSQ